jgi:Tfp pilus assembly protein FimT
VDTLIVVAIIGITSALASDLIGSTNSAIRAQQTAQECQTALTYARSLAITSGNTCGVRFDTNTQQFWVWQNATPATPLSTSFTGGATYLFDLVNTPAVAGVSMVVSIPTDAANPFDVQYTQLGATTNTGSVTFTYAGKTSTVTIPAVGDPTLN